MNKQILRQIVKDLRSTKKENFNMKNWKNVNKCGTTACAIGTYCLNHPRSKLQLVPNLDEYFIPKLGDLTEFEAIEKFLDLSEKDADYLFDSYYYDMKDIFNPEAVARRIELFIEGYVDYKYYQKLEEICL